MQLAGLGRATLPHEEAAWACLWRGGHKVYLQRDSEPTIVLVQEMTDVICPSESDMIVYGAALLRLGRSCDWSPVAPRSSLIEQLIQLHQLETGSIQEINTERKIGSFATGIHVGVVAVVGCTRARVLSRLASAVLDLSMQTGLSRSAHEVYMSAFGARFQATTSRVPQILWPMIASQSYYCVFWYWALQNDISGQWQGFAHRLQR